MIRTVRTVLKDVSPDLLGVTYLHEHLILDSRLIAETMAHIHLPHAEDAVEELNGCVGVGVGSVVDAMPAGAGRGVERLAHVSLRTGVHVIAATGLHTEKYYRDVPWAVHEGVDELAARFIADVEEGIDRHDYLGTSIDRTPHRAGIIKAATSANANPSRDRRVFEAAVIASRRTGVPLLTHCEEGLGAGWQIELLRRFGMPLERVVMSHTDKVEDYQYHHDLLESGVRLEYDQALRQGSSAVDRTARLVRKMIDAGFLRQLMLGTDGARRTLWTSLGGQPGLAWLASGFRQSMRAAGISDGEQRVLFVENPREFLAMAEVEDSGSV